MPDASTTQLILAALGGGAASNALALVTKRAEFSREDHARGLAQRQAAYQEFLRTALDAWRHLSWLRDIPAAKLGPAFLTDKAEQFRQSAASLASQTDVLELLAPADVLDACRRIDLSVRTEDTALAVDGEPDHQGSPDLLKLIDVFRKAARRDLRLGNMSRAELYARGALGK